MPLWGAVEGSEALPKFLTTAQLKRCLCHSEWLGCGSWFHNDRKW